MILVKKVEVDYYDGHSPVEIYTKLQKDDPHMSLCLSPRGTSLRSIYKRYTISGVRICKAEYKLDGFGRPIKYPPTQEIVYDETIGWTKEVEETIGIPLETIYRLQQENKELAAKLSAQLEVIFKLQKTINKIRNMPILNRLFNFTI